VLVGGLAAGGKGHFALDITDATIASDADAMNKFLWEFHAGSVGATNLGYSYSRASIVKMNNEQWAAVIGNGYLSATGVASLYVLDVSNGSVIREILVPDVDQNGLSSPTLIDQDGDGQVDVAYAGDRNGNLWKFDLLDENPANWSVSNGKPLFQTMDIGGKRQSITTAPEVGKHPYVEDSYMVYVGTGELFTFNDSIDKSLQSVYGIWDNDWDAADLPVSLNTLLSQKLKSGNHVDTGRSIRTVTDFQPDWDTQRGWHTPMVVADAGSFDLGERVLQNITLRDDRIQFITINPTVLAGENWYIQLNAFTGGAPIKTIIDVNEDTYLSTADNVDGDGNGAIEDEALDRVVGWYLGFGLTSLPTIGGKDDATAAALFNHIEAIKPAEPPNVSDDPGVRGGHFDLDTSHMIYEFSDGETDGHVHEWDDDYNTTTIDYFNMVPPDKLYGINDVAGWGLTDNVPFFLTLSNTHLNSAAVIEINGGTIPVVAYQALQTRWMQGTMAPYENFPMYKLGAVSAAEEAAGIQQLTSLKISFDSFAILKGQLIGTETGCVKGNDPGEFGEYRNGALTLQATHATGFSGFTYNAPNDVYVGANVALDGTFGYARVDPAIPNPDNNDYDEWLLWESTIFWHWDGDCYADASWREDYEACWGETVTQICWTPDEEAEAHAEKTKTKDKEEPPPPDPEEPTPDDPPPPADAVSELESVTISDGGQAGRLFWRELVPDN